MTQMWAKPAEVYRACGYGHLQALYRDIRLGQFPFHYVKRGRLILINLRSIGLVADNTAKEETRGQVVVSQATA
jgi:hypothetical protein